MKINYHSKSAFVATLMVLTTCIGTAQSVPENNGTAAAAIQHGHDSAHPDPLSILVDHTVTVSEVLHRSDENNSEHGTSPSTHPGSSPRSLPVSSLRPIHDGSPEGTIYLTFDDGPMSGTSNVLRVLAQEHVPATMFCVGKQVEANPDLFRIERSMPDLLVANHTFSHAHGHYRKFYSDAYGVMSDIEHAQLDIGGRKFLRLAGRNVWRIPGRSRNDYALGAGQRAVEAPKYDLISHEGFYIYGWDVEWHFDPKSGHPVDSVDTVISNILAASKRQRGRYAGRVVLLAHDFMFRTPQAASALRLFISRMKTRHWRFATIDRYCSSRPDILHVTRYYRPGSSIGIGRLALRERFGSAHRSRASVHTPSAVVRQKVQRAENRSPQKGIGALVQAVRSYRAQEVRELIDAGVPVNAMDAGGRTPLNTAVRVNSLRLVRTLIRHGARIGFKDARGYTALAMARRYRREEIEAYLSAIGSRRVAVAETAEKPTSGVASITKGSDDALSILTTVP